MEKSVSESSTSALSEEKRREIAQADARLRKIDDFTDVDRIYEELLKSLDHAFPGEEHSLVKKAYQIAREAHKDQVRKSGEPYIIHPLSVGLILVDLGLDEESVAAGLLHDVVEDTIMTKEDLAEEFGEEVALIVDGVTKLGQLNYVADKMEKQAENMRKMLLAMSKDIRVIMVKLSDRLHNMRTLKYMKPAKQKEISQETQEIYAPIAQRLGISKLKIELDDLALKYLDPEAYQDLARQINLKKGERQEYINSVVEDVAKHIKSSDSQIEASISGRVKHFFSIYRKMKNQNKTLDQIYDLFAVRIIVSTIQDCYASLGVIHEMYKPIPGRFKDYIAMPKPNGYRSLHTTVIGPKGLPFEIQIRTVEMHRVAEYGIAAHWRYKRAADGKKRRADQGDENEEAEKLDWLKEMLEWQNDNANNQEFMSLVKNDLDLFTDSVYCFSPQGDVKTLPKGSCPVDFAYAVHSAVGNRMVGARVNGKLVPIETKLRSGDQVEIITSQNSRGPSRDWLNLVKSTQAKNKINQWFRKTFKEENVARGREMLSSYAKQKGKQLPLYMKPDILETVMTKYGFRDWDSVLAAIGHGGLKEGQVFNRMSEIYEAQVKKEVTDQEILANVEANQKKLMKINPAKGVVTSEGMDGITCNFAKCCRPIPGDEVVGYITRGRGIIVHRSDCHNIMNLNEEDRQRLRELDWNQENAKQKSFRAEVSVFAEDRPGLLGDLSMVFSDRGISILSIHSQTSKKGKSTITLSFEVKNSEELKAIMEKVVQVRSVIEVERTRG
ncbi:MAG: bifunctional (p)ppGpp synthetase/guanosine-3',5'-bis(diphosphate) 3'-pyrophosphohydrolase [Lachnospiraceae bacterium]|nr:bifunctional (p)ppGpp synthetase/guanosine-3',5'-bis(diphosphate) 3'-pyrophosphohydrolase [Lachnospiraceae bacterium]